MAATAGYIMALRTIVGREGGDEVVSLVNIEEAAKTLRVSVQTLRNWIRDGKIGHVRLGRRILFRAEDIEIFVAKGVNEAKQ